LTFDLTRIASYPAFTRLGIFVLALLLIWLPFSLPIYWLLKDDQNLVSLLTMGILFIEFICLLRFWNEKVYQNPNWLKQYGLNWNHKNRIELLKGLSIGLSFTISLFVIEAVLGWLELQHPSTFLIRVIIEGLFIALLVGFAEELLFRGWLLTELQRDYSPRRAIWINSLLFAWLHFIKPLEQILKSLPQFPALVLLGLTLVWARWAHSQRLGICIGIHGGLVWGYYIFKVGKLLQYTGKAPLWLTGIDGNPLAGVMGLLFLGILAFWMRRQAARN
jgi:membrane protease YdiL (CAAX protease family)